MTAIAHLKALRALEAAVRLGSFTAAAEELGVTPAAVGQQVRKLEQALGRQLLIRRPNGFQASLPARHAAAKLASGFATLREAVDLLETDATPQRVSVTVVPTIAERWLAPRLGLFRAAHPEIDLRIDSTQQVFYHTNDSYDFALRYDPPERSPLQAIELFPEWLVPVCTPEIATRVHPEAGGEALAGAPLIAVDRSTVDPDWIEWEEWGARFGYRIGRPSLDFSFTTLALRAAYDGHGVFLAQLSVSLPDILAGRLVAPFGPERCVRTGFPYRLIYLARRPSTRAQRAFVAWIEIESARTQAAMEAYLAG